MRWDRAAKLLTLARTLAGSAEGVTLDEIAAAARVNRRTAERMRDALRELFPALEDVSDGRTRRFRIPGGIEAFYRTPAPDELAELDIAARSLEAQGGTARAALLRSLGDKVGAMLRPAERRRIAPDLDALVAGESLVMQAGPRPLADGGTLATLRDALKALRLCVFDYEGSGGSTYRREVVPYGILFGRAYYLVGPESGKAEPVLWRFDRMAGLRLGRGVPGPPPDFSLRAYAARSFGAFQEPPETVVLRFSPAAAGDARRFEFHPNQTREERADGSLVVRFEAGGFREIAAHLFGWGDAVAIVGPDKLRSMMVDMLRSALASHERPT